MTGDLSWQDALAKLRENNPDRKIWRVLRVCGPASWSSCPVGQDRATIVRYAASELQDAIDAERRGEVVPYER
jgi:hypothetical protein